VHIIDVVYITTCSFQNENMAKARKICSHIDLQTLASSTLDNLVTLTSDLLTSGQCMPRAGHGLYDH